MVTEKEIYAQSKLMYNTAKEDIAHINDKMETLNVQREYQKGLRDAAYEIMQTIDVSKKEKEKDV